ncbi:unnamed protein product [Urochloa humidicola]
MFNPLLALAKFEDCPRHPKTKRLINAADRDRVQKALSVAIVLFGEATRFRSIFKAILSGIRYAMNKYELAASHWSLIRNWSTGSRVVLKLDKNGLPALHTEAPEHFSKVQVIDPETGQQRTPSKLEDVIGDDGEITLVLSEPGLLADKETIKELAQKLKKPSTGPILEPGFEESEEEEEEEEN